LRKFILDTGIASDYINRRRGVYQKARQEKSIGSRIGIGTPILGELWAGIHGSASKDRNEKLLRRSLEDLVIWPYEKKAAEEFGRLFAELRRVGRPMQQIDIQIAAIALSLGNCTVVTKDSDFRTIPGLNVVDWSVLP
jgi:tRNA(fMet)-specific endonuclease VapC